MKFLKLAVLCLFVLACFFNQYRKNPINTFLAIIRYPSPDKNYLRAEEQAIEKFKNLIPKGSIVGYFASNKIVADENMTSDVVNYYLMQFFFASVVFAPDKCDYDYVLINNDGKKRNISSYCKKSNFSAVYRKRNISLYKKINNVNY